jgi:hypothetical protein
MAHLTVTRSGTYMPCARRITTDSVRLDEWAAPARRANSMTRGRHSTTEGTPKSGWAGWVTTRGGLILR